MAMKKLLSLVGAAASAAASTSDAATSSSSSSSSSSVASPSSLRITSSGGTRRLQDQDGGGYAYLDDLSGYGLEYASCLRVKVPRENDDDEVDGNVNFYNGRYHAQYQIFATFRVCGDGCSDCDYDTQYAMEVGDFLDTQLDHWEDYCDNCQNACGGRRRLEDEANAQVDCNTCSNQCTDYYKCGEEGNCNDESAYVECAEGDAVSDDGLQLYYGPQCSDDGRIVIGTFYDDECTIKTSKAASDFDYYKFDTVGGQCLDCSSDDGQESCGDLYGEAYHCVNGLDQRGEDDEMSVCSSVQKAFTKVDYSGVKKRRKASDVFLKTFFVLLAMSAVGGFFLLSYTYYVRHRGEKAKPMLSEGDVHDDAADAPESPAVTGTLT
ncbi:hypothetical protein ACHAWF_011645 [Thalassiosira exigua]